MFKEIKMSETETENGIQQSKFENNAELDEILSVDVDEQQKVLDTIERFETLQDGDEALLSKLRKKLVSRKLMVWATATTFFCLDMISEDTWTMFSLLYMGAQGALDLIKMWRETKK